MKTILVTTAAASMLAMAAMAQNSEVGNRRENQQDRIAQGVNSGQLTAGETANLENKESAVNQGVRADRALNGGHLTSQEKRVVNQQQNRLSNQVFQDKHNSPHSTTEIMKSTSGGRTNKTASPTGSPPAS